LALGRCGRGRWRLGGRGSARAWLRERRADARLRVFAGSADLSAVGKSARRAYHNHNAGRAGAHV